MKSKRVGLAALLKSRRNILIILLALVLAVPACTAPSWVAEAENIAKVALPIVEGITSIVGAGPVVTQVVKDINLLITLFEQYQATPATTTLQQIQAGLTTVNADMQQILPAAHIQDAATQNKVTAIVQLVLSEFSNIASLVPEAAGSGQKAVGSKQAPELPFTAKEFKAQYNKIVRTKTGDPVCDRAFEGKELK
jgi:hypothetical protein